jgi:predicted MFS family arabinose efflux permease
MSGSSPGRLFTISFTALLVGQVISILGDRLNNIALIEMLAEETGRFQSAGSAFELSKLALAMTLPSLLLGPLIGAFVDRARRKQVLVASDVVRGFAVLAILVVRPALPLWTVYGVVAFLYLTNLFFLPARCAVVPEIVERGNLLRANSLLSLGATLATIAGFGLGGILVTRAGWRLALEIDAATYFVSAATLAFLSPGARAGVEGPGARTSYPRAIREAVAQLKHLAGARAGVLVPPLVVMAGTIAYVLGVALVESRSDRGTMLVGLLISLAGAGMAMGCYLTGRMLRGVRREKVALSGALATVLALALVGATRSLWVAGLAAVVAGFAAGPVLVASETAIQEEAIPERRATVFAVRDTLMKLGSALAALAAPAVGTLLGLGPAMVVLLCALAPLVALLAWWSRPRPQGSA